MKKHPEKYGLKNALLIGIIFYPVFIILDIIMYPDYFAALLAIRAAVLFGFVILYALMYRVDDNHLYILMYLSFFIAAFGITLMCFVTNQGFASPYYAGNFLVLISASIFFRIKMKAFVRLLSSIILQHFILLLFIPYVLQDVLINIFFLGGCTAISIIIHHALLNLYEENSLLKEFIPICAKCKKIRDDKGYWNQVENYITEHSTASFSHGICPECSFELYGKDYNHILQKNRAK